MGCSSSRCRHQGVAAQFVPGRQTVNPCTALPFGGRSPRSNAQNEVSLHARACILPVARPRSGLSGSALPAGRLPPTWTHPCAALLRCHRNFRSETVARDSCPCESEPWRERCPEFLPDHRWRLQDNSKDECQIPFVIYLMGRESRFEASWGGRDGTGGGMHVWLSRAPVPVRGGMYVLPKADFMVADTYSGN